jgi:hypothetical protein
MIKNIAVLIVLLFGFFLNAALTEQQKRGVDETIKSCDAKVDRAYKGRNVIANLSKPSTFSSSEKKANYKDKDLFLKAFDAQFKDYVEMTTGKVATATANGFGKLEIKRTMSLTNVDTKSFFDLVNSYSSNCTRLSDGLVEFANYAETGKTSDIYKSVFAEWLGYAKCGKRSCPK